MRQDVYQRLPQQESDDSPWTDEEMELLAWEPGKRTGWEDISSAPTKPASSDLPRPGSPSRMAMTGPSNPAGKTIERVLEEFLDEQEARLSPATFRKYENIVQLLHGLGKEALLNGAEFVN